MTEEEARDRVAALMTRAMSRLDRYTALLLAENKRQNLIARSTEGSLWARHLLDSAQLIRFARAEDRTWLDVGSGAGLPGIVLATADMWEVTLVEPRRRRTEFLETVITELQLTNVSVIAADVRSVSGCFDVVSARAVASVADVLGWTRNCTTSATRFILPKGRSAAADVDSAGLQWHGSFHVKHSLTDPTAGIVIAERVAPR